MSFLPIIIVFTTSLLCGLPQLPLQRGMPANTQEVPLAAYGFGNPIGAIDRKADHATVAMNDDLDIAIAFHTSRTVNGDTSFKQVEVAYYEHQANDTWNYIDTVLVGSMYHNPVGGLSQLIVKCERPDIIAVGNKFFVTWTRRYDKSFSGQEHEPAVLECAWIERGIGPSIVVKGDPTGLLGLGYILAAHAPLGTTPEELFEVLECAGVPDAVVLNDSKLIDTLKVAVAYPHQEVFSNPPNLDRRFAIRLVTCELDLLTGTISSSTPVDIQSTVLFNGPSASGGNSSAGLILPDLAPSSENNAFWLAAEAQTVDSASSLPNGRIRLEYWQQVGGVWTAQAGKTFKSPSGGVPFIRRRPKISSYPASHAVGEPQAVTLAFNKVDPNSTAIDSSTNIVLAEWQYLNGSGSAPPIMISPWQNDLLKDDVKPVPLRGADSPMIRRCFATRAPSGGSLPIVLLDFDAFGSVTTTLETRQLAGTVARPAVAYQHESLAANPDYIAVTFEKKILASDPLRIWLGVE